MKRLFPIIVIAGMFLASGCSKDHELSLAGQAFVSQSSMGLYGDNVTYLQYDKFNHQFTRNYSGTEFRISNGNLDVYFSCNFSSVPSAGKSVNTHIVTHGLGLDEVIDGEFYVAKADGTLCWMWCEEKRLGIVAYIEKH